MTNYYIKENDVITQSANFKFDDNCLETEEEIIRYDGQLILASEYATLQQTPEYIAEQLAKAKADKLAENESIAKETRYSKYFTLTVQDQSCDFDTSSTTDNDLTKALAITSTGLTYNGWITNNGIVLNLTFDDVKVFMTKFLELSNVYPTWLYYKNLVEKATTIDEVNAIVIDYSVDVTE